MGSVATHAHTPTSPTLTAPIPTSPTLTAPILTAEERSK